MQADRRCYVLYSTHACKLFWNKKCSTQGYGTNGISLESRALSQRDIAFENMLDAIDGSPATGTSVAGIPILFVDGLFGTGGNKFEQRVLDEQTDSSASTRPGFRMGCQMAASRSWNIFHIDLKTAFLQGQSYGVNRDVVSIATRSRSSCLYCCKIEETCL